MPEDFPKQITEKTQEKFAVSELGLYALSITARCKAKNYLRVEIDGRLFREIPPKDNIQKNTVPPAWNGKKLKGRSQTNIFLLQLDKGEHIIAFIPQGQAKVEKYNHWQIEDPIRIEFNLDQQAEDGDKRPWLNFVLVDLPFKSIAAEATVNWHYFDGDDVKLIIDNEIEKNSSSILWRNWLWHATPQQIFKSSKKEQKTVVKNLNSGTHYIEFWADKTPTLHQVVINLGNQELPNVTTVDNPKWTDNFNDDSDQMLLARLILGEMEGQQREAKLGAGFTVVNRLKKSRSNWGLSLKEIILKESQYDAFRNSKTVGKVKDPLSHVSKAEWESCYEIAGIVLSEKEIDPTKGATHFYSTATNTGFPWWATEDVYRVKIGITYFYELER